MDVVHDEDDQPDDPAAIADWCRWLDSLRPLELTPEQEQRIADARREFRVWELATQGEYDVKLRGQFQR